MRIGAGDQRCRGARSQRGPADPGTHLPASRIVSRDEALRLNPLVAPKGVTGGAVWYDYQMHSTDRVTLSFLLSAVDAGAVRRQLRRRRSGFCRRYGRVTGVKAEDRAHRRRRSTIRGVGGRQCRRPVGRVAARRPARRRRKARRRRGCRAP